MSSPDVLILATSALKRLNDLEAEREQHNSAYGDSRGAYYRGTMSDDLRQLAGTVLKTSDMPPLGTPEFKLWWAGFIAGLIEAHQVKP